MSPETDGTVHPLTRREQKELLALVCAADRLEWQLQARKWVRARPRPARWLLPAARLGLAWLPARGRRGGGQTGRRAWLLLRTALDLFG